MSGQLWAVGGGHGAQQQLAASGAALLSLEADVRAVEARRQVCLCVCGFAVLCCAVLCVCSCVLCDAGVHVLVLLLHVLLVLVLVLVLLAALLRARVCVMGCAHTTTEAHQRCFCSQLCVIGPVC